MIGNYFEDNGPLTIVGLDNWDTSDVTDMSRLFSSAQIESVGDISGWDTSNVTKMSWTFGEMLYYGDDVIDVSSWDVSKVTEWTSFNPMSNSLFVLPAKFTN